MLRFSRAAGLLLGLAFVSPSQAAVTVIGGGMAQGCSQAAINGEDDERYVELCTLALETEYLRATDRAGTFVNRGVLRLRRADYAEARRDFNLALKLKGDLGEAYVNRGATAIAQQRYADGLSDINRGLALGVEEPAKAYYNRALAHEGLEDAKSAYYDYQKAVEIRPDWQAPKDQLTRFTVSRR